MAFVSTLLSSPTAKVVDEIAARQHRAAGPRERRADGEDVHGDCVLQERFGGLQLIGVFIRRRQRRVGRGEAVGADDAVLVAEVVRGDLRHVAVDAALRLGRVVERARAHARDAAGLPVVVVVEAADPPVAVHRHVEVDLVARRAEVGGLLFHERLQERAPMRLGVHVHDEVVEEPHDGLLARGQIRQRRILHREAALAHRAVDRDDRVTRHAPEPGLRFGRIQDLCGWACPSGR